MKITEAKPFAFLQKSPRLAIRIYQRTYLAIERKTEGLLAGTIEREKQ